MSANSKQALASAALPIEEPIRLLRADVEFAAQSFHCWERYVHYWGKPLFVSALNQFEAQIWFQVSEWSTMHTTLMALGRLYDKRRGTVTFERTAVALLERLGDPARSAEWKELTSEDASFVVKLTGIRNEAMAHRREDPRIVFDRHALLVSDLEALVENAKRKIKWLELVADLPVVPFFAKEQVFKSVDAVVDALLDRQAKRKDAWARIPRHYEFIRLLQAHPAVTRLIVFGSWARGEQRPSSDIDLAIEATGASSQQRAEVDAILEEPDTLRKVDVVWLDRLPAGSSLWEAIRRDGQALKGATIE